jgi:peptidoglycan hydrolase-like protein with peptidoglycan-binding domain
MTDVYLAYAREDREGVRILAEMLQFEGWDVWMDPSVPTGETSAAIDMKLGSAGAILVLWSGYSRHSEYVRSEAATGLYKNKLIQASLDGEGAPRPFDGIEVIDFAGWTGERDHPQWRRIIDAVRLYAGAPGSARPLVQRRAVSGPPAYLEPRRQMAWGPVVAAGLLMSAGAGLWMADPFGWRATRTAVAAPAEAGSDAAFAAGESAEAAVPRTYEDSEASQMAWGRVDRKNPDALRDYAADFPNASSAETARSLLRVLDAQAWVDAVTSDNEGGYQSYLKKFPADAASPGAMALAAQERLGSLRVEREQAIVEIQTGLATLGLYQGEVDGHSGDRTVRAVRQFASQNRRTAPTLASAAPRDLRALAEAIQAVVAKRPDAPAATAVATPAAPPASAAVTAAAEADRLRLAQAQAASQAAAQAATQVATTQAARLDADTLAQGQLQTMSDTEDWAAARQANTVSGYQAYVAKHPTGLQAAAARAAIADLGKPAAFAIDQVPAAVRAPIEAARRAQTTANSRASAARDAASQASVAPGKTSIVADGGDQYDAQISGGAPNGLGTRVSGNPTNSGDRYSGQLRNGQSAGVGVYEFADNPGNSSAGALRYEGEHAGDVTAGHGVIYWRNGDRFAGEARADGSSRGVLTFSNGQRYEGELRDGNRNGFGVVWSADGTVVMAGRWVDGELVEPVAPASE